MYQYDTLLCIAAPLYAGRRAFPISTSAPLPRVTASPVYLALRYFSLAAGTFIGTIAEVSDRAASGRVLSAYIPDATADSEYRIPPQFASIGLSLYFDVISFARKAASCVV
jgi:hypothetical protein